MAASILTQVLQIFEETDQPFSVSAIARSLEVSPERLEGMLQYWVRKGRIREVVDAADCGTCGVNGSCPFVIDMPKSYELVNDTIVIPLHTIQSSCQHHPGNL